MERLKGAIQAGGGDGAGDRLPPSFRNMTQSLDQISEFTENNFVVFKEAAAYFRKRLALEEELAKSLTKLTRSTYASCKPSFEVGNNLAKSCDSVLSLLDGVLKEESEAIATATLAIPDTLKETERVIKNLRSDREKCVRALRQSYASHYKVRSRFVATQRELQVGPYVAEKGEQLRKRLAALEKETNEAVVATNALQAKFYSTELPDLIQRYHDLNQQLGIFIENHLRIYYSMLVSTIPARQQLSSSMSEFVVSADYLASMKALDELKATATFALPEAIEKVDLHVAAAALEEDTWVHVSAADVASVHSGWLYRQGDTILTWKRRWVVLSTDCALYVFRSPEDKECLARVPLVGTSLETLIESPSISQEYAFRLSMFQTAPALFAAETDAELNQWTRFITASTQLGQGAAEGRGSIAIPKQPATKPTTPAPKPAAKPSLPGLPARPAPLAPASSSTTSSPIPSPSSSSSTNAGSASSLGGASRRPRFASPSSEPQSPQQPEEPSSSSSSSSSSQQKAVAKFACVASQEDELSFAAGETLYFVSANDAASEWRVVRNENGKQGLVPANYLSLV